MLRIPSPLEGGLGDKFGLPPDLANAVNPIDTSSLRNLDRTGVHSLREF